MPKFRSVLVYVFPPLTVLFGLLWLFKRGSPPPKPIRDRETSESVVSESPDNHISQTKNNHLFGKTEQFKEQGAEHDECQADVGSEQLNTINTGESVDADSNKKCLVQAINSKDLPTDTSTSDVEKIRIEKNNSCRSKPSCIESIVNKIDSEIVAQNHIVENGGHANTQTLCDRTLEKEPEIDSEIIEEVFQKSVTSASELKTTPEIFNSLSQSSHHSVPTSGCHISNSDKTCVLNSIENVVEKNLLNDIESQIILPSQNSAADVIINECNSEEDSVLKGAAKIVNSSNLVNNINLSDNSSVERQNQDTVSSQPSSHSSDSSTSVLKSDTLVTKSLDSRTYNESAHEGETVSTTKKLECAIEQSNIINNNLSQPSLSQSSQHVQNSQHDSSSLTPEQQKSTSSPESSSYDSNSEASNDSGKGASVTEPPGLIIQNEITVYEFNFPSDLCGRLIGRFGKNINYIKDQSGATLSVRNNPYTPAFQICSVEGTQSEIDTAIDIVKKKFPRSKFPNVDLTPINQSRLSDSPLLMPEIMQMNLPEGVSVDVLVSSIVNAGQIFIQQPTHPSFPSLERLNHFMVGCYSQEGAVPPLPRPIEVGVICAAPMMNGWFRAQVVTVYDETDECDIRYVDYGGYATVQSSLLKQIRSDFMSLPFQAVECYMGNITPADDEEYFSTEAAAVLEELTQGKLLQAQVVARGEDSVPYIHVYQINGSRAVLINREMVNRGVARWVEVFS